MILNSKDKGKRSETNAEEAGTSEGRAGFFQVSGVPPPFYLFWFFMLDYEASLVAQRVKRLPARQDCWFRKIPGEGNGNPFWYSCLENPMDGQAWYRLVHGVTKSRT